MEKLSYDYYSENYLEIEEKYKLDYCLDMENTADMKYMIDCESAISIGMINKDADQVAAWLPDGEYVYVKTSLPEVIAAIESEYNIRFNKSYE